MPLPEVCRGEVVGVEEQYHGRRLQRRAVRSEPAGRDVAEEDVAGLEEERCQEGLWDAEGRGLLQELGREARG